MTCVGPKLPSAASVDVLIEGIPIGRAPLFERWISDEHTFERGVCTNCGQARDTKHEPSGGLA